MHEAHIFPQNVKLCCSNTEPRERGKRLMSLLKFALSDLSLFPLFSLEQSSRHISSLVKYKINHMIRIIFFFNLKPKIRWNKAKKLSKSLLLSLNCI